MSEKDPQRARALLAQLRPVAPVLAVVLVLVAAWFAWSGWQTLQGDRRVAAVEQARDAALGGLRRSLGDELTRLGAQLDTPAVQRALTDGDLTAAGTAVAFATILAVVAGLVSFLSPCILPLVPGYLGYVSGLADPRRADNRRRVMTGVGLFIMGFAAVFTLYGAAFGLIGGWLLRWQDLLIRILGVLVILMGLALMGMFTFLQRTTTPSFTPRTGLAGAPL